MESTSRRPCSSSLPKRLVGEGAGQQLLAVEGSGLANIVRRLQGIGDLVLDGAPAIAALPVLGGLQVPGAGSGRRYRRSLRGPRPPPWVMAMASLALRIDCPGPPGHAG